MSKRTGVRSVAFAAALLGAHTVEAQVLPGDGDGDLPCEVRIYDVDQCDGFGSHRTANNSVRNAKGESHSGLCYVCYSGENRVSAYECHPQNCLGDGEPAAMAAYADLVRAARHGDLAAMLRIAPSVPGMVAVNHERRAVQIRTCSGAVIGSLPVDDDELLGLFQASLARADVAFVMRQLRAAAF